MVIQRLHIDSFGSQKNVDLQFTRELNVIEGQNESGKTTIAAFIKFILYGSNSEKYTEPFSTGGIKGAPAGGYLVVSDKEKQYRIEREIVYSSGSTAGREKSRIIDLNTNMQCDRSAIPGEFFLGVSEDIFDNTAMAIQHNGRCLEIDGAKVNAEIESALFSPQEDFSTQNAIAKLNDCAEVLFNSEENGGKIFDLTLQRDLLASELERASNANSQIISIEGDRAGLLEKFAQNNAKYDELSLKLNYFGLAQQARQFQDLDALKAKEKRLISEYEQNMDTFAYENFVPDKEYVQKLKTLWDELAGLSPEVRMLPTVSENNNDEAFSQLYDEGFEKSKKAAKKNKGKNHENSDGEAGPDAPKLDYERYIFVKSMLAEDESAEDILDEYDAYKSRSFICRFLGIVSCMLIIAAVCAGAFLFITSKLIYAVICAGPAVVFTVLACVFLGIAGKAHDNIDSMLDDFDCVDEKELVGVFEELRKIQESGIEPQPDENETLQEKKQRLHTTADLPGLHSAESVEHRAFGTMPNAFYAEKKAELDMLLQKWGYADDTDVGEVIAAAQDILDYIEAFQRKRDKYRTSLNALEQQLRDSDREALAEEFQRASEQFQAAGYTEEDHEKTGQNLPAMKREVDFIAKANIALKTRLDELDKQLAQLYTDLGSPASIAENIRQLEEELSSLTARNDAVRLARESLSKASDRIRDSVSPRLAEQAGEYLSDITNGKYSIIRIDHQLRPEFASRKDNGLMLTHSMESMSSGMRDIAYISLRLALGNLFYKKSAPPMVWDECFSHLDDQRLKAVLKLLSVLAKKEKLQFVLFTSQNREAAILKSIAEFGYIAL